MKPKVTIITPTYNKPRYLLEAALSVRMQTRDDWLWWLVLNGADEETKNIAWRLKDDDPEQVEVFDLPTTEEERKAHYIPAQIVNEYYPKVSTPYLCFFSDDDILDERYVAVLAGMLDAHPEWDVVYGECTVCCPYKSRWIDIHELRAEVEYGPAFIHARSPDGKVDGGQIMQTSHSHKHITRNGWKLDDTWPNACHIDGIYMHELSKAFTFHPIKTRVLTHRMTPLSTHRKSQ